MAGGKIRGITIEIDGDATGLQTALDNVDNSLKETQKQLKDVNKLLKLDPSNVELLRQKQELLTKAVDEAGKRMESLRAVQKELGERTEKNAAQYDAVEREIIATKAAQEEYERQLKEMGPVVETFSDKLSKIGDSAAAVAEKTKVLSAAAASVGAAILGNAFNAASTADEILTMARNMGISVEELQRMQYASNLVDVSVDQMAGSYSKLVKAMGSGSRVFEELGVNIYDSTGELRNASDVWYDSLQALSLIDNATERDAKAMELFGKSAMELSGIIDDGGEALRAYGDEAERAGLVMSDDVLKAASELQDQVDRLKTTTQMALLQTGAALAKELVPALEAIVKKASEVLRWVAELDGKQQKLIVTILGVVAAISPLASMISKVSTLFKGASSAIGFISSPIGMAVLAIGALVAAGITLYKHWDELKAYAAQLKENLSSNFESAKESVVGAFQTIITWAGELPARVANGILEQLGLAVSAAQELGQGVINKIAEFFGQAKQAGSDLISKVSEGISEAFNSIKEFLAGIGSAIVDGIWGGISGAIGQFTQNVKGFFTGIVDTVKRDLGIQSPSKVFAYIGEMMGAGIEEGWNKSMSAFNPGKDLLISAGGAALASGAAGGNNYGFTNNINLYGQYYERDGLNIAMSIDKWLGERI